MLILHCATLQRFWPTQATFLVDDIRAYFQIKSRLSRVEEGEFLRVVRSSGDREYRAEFLTDGGLFKYKRYVEEFIDLIVNQV